MVNRPTNADFDARVAEDIKSGLGDETSAAEKVVSAYIAIDSQVKLTASIHVEEP